MDESVYVEREMGWFAASGAMGRFFVSKVFATAAREALQLTVAVPLTAVTVARICNCVH
ncbi:hypothetical protein [Mycobacterium sp. 3-98]|uniref:hypothetical protein n=1 Tax=Mycobacterium sp. 3-98 TaxID=3042317 RepID=UPI002DD97D07|nr:hypothetical protein [Mycobacterium sp. 3-98]WSE45586.1 hypothetical protein QGN30_21115 [Mycobacterium sp. 3-98]